MNERKEHEISLQSIRDISCDSRALLEEYYTQATANEGALDSSWRACFGFDPERLSLSKNTVLDAPLITPEKINEIANTFRLYGHLSSYIDPLKKEPELGYELKVALDSCKGFEHEIIAFPPTFSVKQGPLSLFLKELQAIYAKSIGIEYYPFCSGQVSAWIQQKFEPLAGKIAFSAKEKQTLYRLLMQAEVFEAFLGLRFVGQKRFSCEGAETLIPALFMLLEHAALSGVKEVVLGMPHRGRLNVLANIFNKPLQDVIREFHGALEEVSESAGDVKYHKGYSSSFQADSGGEIKLEMCHNPSHLESVDPVATGFAYARQKELLDAQKKQVLPILIHGDAAISGQGVVYENLQQSRLTGYGVGGTIHIVLNNQIGFTAFPEDSRSTRYCTDIAKAFGFPVFHVNAENVESVVFAFLCALELRQELATDVFIDLNCYRKYGHNESDEPAFTQPLLYEIIKNKKSIREMYTATLLQEGLEGLQEIEEHYRQVLHQAFDQVVKEEQNVRENKAQKENPHVLCNDFASVDLLQLLKSLTKLALSCNIHPKLKKMYQARLDALEKEGLGFLVDWATSESLALGALLLQGKNIRLVGQDTRRGTFSQRHAAIADQHTGTFYVPLNELQESRGTFEVYDSLLSEYAALGFEYGYSLGKPQDLVMWEAQFGDFANGAQIIIDQYIAAGKTKWGNESRLTLLLPHGYEGQGPEHSSARIERFLQLSANHNMILANPTQPANYCHLLLKQALCEHAVPLVVFSPKALLRHPLAKNRLDELQNGQFQEIIEDHIDKREVRRVVLCSGKLYFDLLEERVRSKNTSVALIRLEQLYPLDVDRLRGLIRSYESRKELYWAQEEPQNNGAWSYIFGLFYEDNIRYIGRKAASSPAVSSHKRHEKEQQEIVQRVFEKEEI